MPSRPTIRKMERFLKFRTDRRSRCCASEMDVDVHRWTSGCPYGPVVVFLADGQTSINGRLRPISKTSGHPLMDVYIHLSAYSDYLQMDVDVHRWKSGCPFVKIFDITELKFWAIWRPDFNRWTSTSKCNYLQMDVDVQTMERLTTELFPYSSPPVDVYVHLKFYRRNLQMYC